MSAKDVTHEFIADTAYKILCKKPITKFTMTELSEACGIIKPTLYHHYKDKFEVAQYICKRFSDEFYRNNTLSDILHGKSAETQFYIIRHQDYFRNVMCYDGQNNVFDYLAELELSKCKKRRRKSLGQRSCQKIFSLLLSIMLIQCGMLCTLC